MVEKILIKVNAKYLTFDKKTHFGKIIFPERNESYILFDEWKNGFVAKEPIILQFVSVSKTGMVSFMDTETGLLVRVFAGRQGFVYSYFLTGKYTVRTYQTKKPLTRLKVGINNIYKLLLEIKPEFATRYKKVFCYE